MSHITRIKTGFKEKKYLLLALKDLGYQPHEGKKKIRGFGGIGQDSDIWFSPGLLSYEVGFHANPNGEYDMVADWAGVRGIQREELRQKLAQRYAYHAARERLEEQGFSLANEEVGEDGQIRLVLRRMG